MRIAIVGSREFPDLQMVRDYVRTLPEGTVVISGGARGVDAAAVYEAKRRKLSTVVFLADWAVHGKRAGYLRNRKIVEAADKVVAFWDGKSKGTLHSINLAHELKKECDIRMIGIRMSGKCKDAGMARGSSILRVTGNCQCGKCDAVATTQCPHCHRSCCEDHYDPKRNKFCEACAAEDWAWKHQ